MRGALVQTRAYHNCESGPSSAILPGANRIEAGVAVNSFRSSIVYQLQNLMQGKGKQEGWLPFPDCLEAIQSKR